MRFIEGQCREQLVLIPESLDALIGKDNEMRMIDLFVLIKKALYNSKLTEIRHLFFSKTQATNLKLVV
ncbi:MAG: hypothetical protein IT275_12395 [Chitinophagales bacterium]|mgnify:CR=1 FL=1|nr:hypothetical protein [Chitinophagales bacterium]HMN32179.1 hypothetical protein [Chitinophagaceae bacterium]